MKEQYIYNQIIQILKTSIDGNNGYHHLISVSTLMKLYASKLSLDIEIAGIIGLLHDISLYQDNKHDSHALNSSLKAKQILINSKLFDEEEIDIIVQAIKNHSDKEHYDNKYPYDCLIKDCDMLASYLDEPNQVFNDKINKRLEDLLSL